MCRAAPFPKARIEPDHIYVKDRRIYATAGVSAGIDLSLLLIEEDFGGKLALPVAGYLISSSAPCRQHSRACDS
jgi:transcriptional regulator GlxA family with amidase domain